MQRESRPARRNYVGVDEIPDVLNGLGIAILSTSKGVMAGRDAEAANLGGEVLCSIY
jgi:small subunit ribosomal protein S8